MLLGGRVGRSSTEDMDEEDCTLSNGLSDSIGEKDGRDPDSEKRLPGETGALSPSGPSSSGCSGSWWKLFVTS